MKLENGGGEIISDKSYAKDTRTKWSNTNQYTRKSSQDNQYTSCEKHIDK